MEPQQTCPTEEMLLMLSETAPSAIEEVAKYPGFSLPPISQKSSLCRGMRGRPPEMLRTAEGTAEERGVALKTNQ